MKTYAAPSPLGKGHFEPICAVRYMDDTDTFEVEFESGEIYQVSHSALRKANRLSGTAEVDSIWVEAEVHAGFLVRYTNGELADCAWDFVKETVEEAAKVTNNGLTPSV